MDKEALRPNIFNVTLLQYEKCISIHEINNIRFHNVWKDEA